jgi:hypothetical protein
VASVQFANTNTVNMQDDNNLQQKIIARRDVIGKSIHTRVASVTTPYRHLSHCLPARKV